MLVEIFTALHMRGAVFITSLSITLSQIFRKRRGLRELRVTDVRFRHPETYRKTPPYAYLPGHSFMPSSHNAWSKDKSKDKYINPELQYRSRRDKLILFIRLLKSSTTLQTPQQRISNC